MHAICQLSDCSCCQYKWFWWQKVYWCQSISLIVLQVCSTWARCVSLALVRNDTITDILILDTFILLSIEKSNALGNYSLSGLHLPERKPYISRSKTSNSSFQSCLIPIAYNPWLLYFVLLKNCLNQYWKPQYGIISPPAPFFSLSRDWIIIDVNKKLRYRKQNSKYWNDRETKNLFEAKSRCRYE